MTELLLIARVAGERIAIAACDVEAVVEIEDIIPVPRSVPHLAGLAALRSRVLTVVDCAASLELGSSLAGASRDAIVVPIDGHPYALLMDEVEDVVEFSGHIEPVRTALGTGWRRVARGTVEAEGDLLLLIDPAGLVSGPQARAA